MFDNNSNNEGARRPRARFQREGAEHVGRPRFTRDGESRPHFTRDGESRPHFTRDGESRPRFSRDGETRPQRPMGHKPKRNQNLYSAHKQQVYREQHEDHNNADQYRAQGIDMIPKRHLLQFFLGHRIIKLRISPIITNYYIL